MISNIPLKPENLHLYTLHHDINKSSIDFDKQKTASFFKINGVKTKTSPLLFNKIQTKVKVKRITNKFNNFFVPHSKVSITHKDTAKINEFIKIFLTNKFNDLALTHKYQHYLDYTPLQYSSKDSLLYVRDSSTKCIIKDPWKHIKEDTYYNVTIHLTAISVKFRYPNEYMAFPIFRIHSIEL